MTFAQFSLGALVLLPLLAAAVSVLLPTSARRVPGVVTSLLVLGLTAPVLLEVGAGAPVELALGGHEPPLGIRLRADGLSVLFLVLTALVGVPVTAFAAVLPAATGQRLVAAPATASTVSAASSPDDAPPRQPLAWRAGHPGFWPLWLACWSGLNAVFLAGDLFNTYVGLELVGLTAVALVALGGTESWRAALRYLYVAVLGALFLLVAIGVLVATTGTLDIAGSAEAIAADPIGTRPAVLLALVLLTIGLSMKVALVPMHGWLIPAHGNAPGAVSPILSALVIKASLFVLLRCWVWLAAPLDDAALTWLGWLLAGLGVAAILLGSVMALRQSRFKPLVAYSTVAQAGYWFLFFPLLLEEEAVVAGALAGTVGLVLGHGLAKAAIFLAAGHLKEAYGSDELTALRGAGARYPMLVMGVGMSVIGLAGLPFSLSFSGKWLLATAAVSAGHAWLVAAIVVATLLSAAYLLRVLAPLLLSEHAAQDPAPRRLPWSAQLPPFTLGALTILSGFAGVPLADLLEVGAPW